MIDIIIDKEKIKEFKDNLENIKIFLSYPKKVEEKDSIIFVDGELFIKSKLLSKLISEGKRISTVKKKYKYLEKLAKLKMRNINKIEQGFYKKKKFVSY